MASAGNVGVYYTNDSTGLHQNDVNCCDAKKG